MEWNVHWSKTEHKDKEYFILILCTFCTTVLMSGKVDTCIIEISNCYAKEFTSIHLYA